MKNKKKLFKIISRKVAYKIIIRFNNIEAKNNEFVHSVRT